MGNKYSRSQKICIAGNASRGKVSSGYYYSANIADESPESTDFRKIIWTSPNLMQLGKMSIKPGEDTGEEVHEARDQFFYIVSGQGTAVLDGDRQPVMSGTVLIVPAGTEHNIINQSTIENLVLVTLYAPKEHKQGLVQQEKPLEDKH